MSAEITVQDVLAKMRLHRPNWNAYAMTRDSAVDLAIKCALELTAAEIEAFRKSHERYETVRRMSVPQFRDAYVLSTRTGKPFDEIIDDLRPFMFPKQ